MLVLNYFRFLFKLEDVDYNKVLYCSIHSKCFYSCFLWHICFKSESALLFKASLAYTCIITKSIVKILLNRLVLLKLSFLTHCTLIDTATVICWTSPYEILGASGLFCSCCSIFDGKSCFYHRLKSQSLRKSPGRKNFQKLFHDTGHIRINESTIIFPWGFHNTLILRVL